MAQRSDARVDAGGDPALFVWIACQLRGLRSEADLEDAAHEIGLDLAGRTMRAVDDKARRLQPGPGAPGAGADVFQSTIEVALDRLGFFEALVCLRPKHRRGVKTDQLAEIAGVLAVMRAESDGCLFIRAAFETKPDRVLLESQLAEFGEIEEWIALDQHTNTAADGWTALAERRLRELTGY